MFITELYLYMDYLEEQLKEEYRTDQFAKKKKYYASFYQNLREGILYYRRLSILSGGRGKQFDKALDIAEIELDSINYQYEVNTQLLTSESE
jgi:hypothetical protein